MQTLFENEIDLSNMRANFELPVNWISTENRTISIHNDTGKLTNVRAATLYEEYLPFVQNEILNTLFSHIN